MPLINLIESNLVAARKSEQQLRISKFALIGSVAIVGLAYMTLLAQGNAVSTEIESVQAQIKKLKPLISQIEAYKKDENELGPKVTTLQDAQDLTNRWGRLLGHFAVNTPADVWVSSMRTMITDPKQPIRVTLMGVAKTQTDASEMMLRVQNSKDLESVNLVGTQERLLEKISAVEYEIAGDIVGTAEAPKKDEPKTEAGA